MAKTKISEFSSTPGNNTDIDGINIAEGCAPSGINDAIRELMAQLKDFQAGDAGDSITVVGTLAAKGTSSAAADLKLYEDTDNGTNYVGFIAPASIASNVQWTLPSADGSSGQALQTNGSGTLSFATLGISAGGTGQTTANAAFNALAPSQTSNAGRYLKTDGTNTSWDLLDISTADITGTLPVANGGTGLTSFTANGVVYASSSSALTTGSALTFDGTKLTNTGSAGGVRLEIVSTGSSPEVSITSADTGTSQINFGGVTTPKKGVFRYSDNSDLFIWFLNSTAEQMRLTSTGLGIGTSSPTSKLTVAGAISVNTGAANLNALYLLSGNSGNRIGLSMGRTAQEAYIGIASTSNSIINGDVAGDLDILTTTGNIRFSTNAGASLQATLDTSGNLGLGVTPSAWSLGKALQIGTSGAAALLGYNNNFYLTANAYYDGSWKYTATAAAGRYQVESGVHSWSYAASGTAGNAISFTQAMTLDASGNLLVGKTSGSGARLEVSGSASGAYISNLVENINAGGYASTNYSVGASGASGTASINYAPGIFFAIGPTSNDTTTPIVFRNNNATERARITSGGDLLIGVTSKSQDTSEGNFVIGFDGAVDNAILTHDTSAATTTNALVFGKNNTVVGSITNTSTSTAFNTSSDYRLKNNPQPLTGSGAFIDALKPKTWNWKADGSKGVGFIAHEVQEVSPGSVVGTKDAVDEEGKPIMQAMEYGSAEFIANIIAELQSLRARVAQLEAK